MVKRDIARHTVIVKRFYFNEVWVLVFETMTTPAVLASGSPLVFGGCQGFVPIKPGNCINRRCKLELRRNTNNGAMVASNQICTNV